MKDESVFSEPWLAWLVMLPSYFLAALFASKFSGIYWLLAMCFLIFFIGKIYCALVIDRVGVLANIKPVSIVLSVIVFQVGLVVFLYSIAIR